MNADGIDHVQRGQALRLQRGGVQVHLHLALLATVRIGHGGPRNRDELGADGVEAIIVELLLGEILSREGQLKNRDARSAIRENERRRCSHGQLPELGLGDRGDLRNALLNVGGRLQKHFNHRNSIKRL